MTARPPPAATSENASAAATTMSPVRSFRVSAHAHTMPPSTAMKWFISAGSNFVAGNQRKYPATSTAINGPTRLRNTRYRATGTASSAVMPTMRHGR